VSSLLVGRLSHVNTSSTDRLIVCSEEAVREAKGDRDKLKERVEEEESLATLNELEQIHTEANEMVLSDKQALTEDRDRFSSDMDRIGEFCSYGDTLGVTCTILSPQTIS